MGDHSGALAAGGGGSAEGDGVPPFPVVTRPQAYRGFPTVLAEGRCTIGWDGQGGDTCFVTVRTGTFGGFDVVGRYPLTEGGWARAWQAFMELRPDRRTVRAVRLALAERQRAADRLAAARELEAETLAAVLEAVFLGGYCPDAGLTARSSYDLRFLRDRLVVLSAERPAQQTALAYADVTSIEIGGPGLVTSGGGYIGGGLGPAGAAEGIAIAAVLNALTRRTRITNIIQIQAANTELFFLEAKTPPQDLRIRLSPGLVALGKAHAAAQPPAPDGAPTTRTIIDELERLSRLYEKGLLTAEEFAQMKTRLISEQ
jgi:hypothetical protein